MKRSPVRSDECWQLEVWSESSFPSLLLARLLARLLVLLLTKALECRGTRPPDEARDGFLQVLLEHPSEYHGLYLFGEMSFIAP